MKTILMLLTASIYLAGITVTGTYSSDFGTLKLKQQGTNITGSYSYPAEGGQTANGTIKGTLKGLVLTFTWEQKQGNSKAGGTGKFTFKKDGKSFTGTWKDSKGKSGSWNGSRQ